MNPLAIKEKMMKKPVIEERERVAVVIKEIKNPRKVSGEEELAQESIIKPIIEMKTDIGFDRKALLTKLAESKKLKVTMKPILEVTEEKRFSEPIPLPEPIMKTKKLDTKKRIIIEEENEELDEDQIEEIGEKMDKKEDQEKEEKEKEDEVGNNEIIPIKLPKKKTRLTGKVEKGIAILGPETIVEIGDTDLRKRLPKKSPPVIIKVSSYYMNNREKFINFINLSNFLKKI